MVSEMRRKLNMESERLHTRLRQELTELRERLSPYPAHPESSESTLAIMGERLAPLTEQLQRAMNDDGEELCGRLRHYLQALEDTTPYQDAVTWLSQTLDDSSAKMSSIIQDFKTKASNMIEEFKGTDEGISWQEVNVRLEQEVRALSLEVQGRMGALKAKVSRFLLVPQAARAEVSTSMEQFCQSAAIQDPSFHTRIEKHLFGHVSQAQSQSQSPTLQPLGSLEEDFSAKLNAVLRDILQTVQ
ncbi:hypothetical protein DPEC_G00300870 [Dallia pectoralis]|uniref:Uncharacterized protein n=1 Tax=Dallia pectoralis TaxID=75939 RepID=A0ACC2FGJ9_DALPE|nr:hypothetical protein DPEC_G00300870 [Dallia pectoralis]